MSKEITHKDILDTIYGHIDESADEYARNQSGYILDSDELGAENNPQKHSYDRIKRHYKAGASPLGERLAEAEQKIKELTQWKKEASWLLDPLLEWGQGRKDIPLGNDITKEILRRAKLFTKAEQRAERYEKALNQLKLHIISCRNHLINPDGLNMLRTIDEALTPKQTTDDTDR